MTRETRDPRPETYKTILAAFKTPINIGEVVGGARGDHKKA